MKYRKSRHRWVVGNTFVKLRHVSEEELAARGHRKVSTVDAKTGYVEQVTLPREPWRQPSKRK